MTQSAPRKKPKRKPFVKKGLILVYTGNGKGKTTAAFGAAFRAAGRGIRVAVVQFIKGKWKSGEVQAAANFGPQIHVETLGEGFTWDTQNLAADIACAERAWKKCVEFLRDPQYGLVIFDEINCVMDYGFLKTAEVVRELKKKPALKHVILTGRGAPQAIRKLADLVTEMKCLKHPFDRGILAQPGIDY